MRGFDYSVKAIPTAFGGVTMRSRLEARWAAFFTLCGWRWTYEPIDLHGWAPDFALHMTGGYVFVEVKPIRVFSVGLREPEAVNVFRRVTRAFAYPDSGARALLVGLTPEEIDSDQPRIGLGVGEGTWSDDGDAIVIGQCGARSPGCGVGMSPMQDNYKCWACGGHDGNPAHHATGIRINDRWARACDITKARQR